jgi:hypothetical protein
MVFVVNIELEFVTIEFQLFDNLNIIAVIHLLYNYVVTGVECEVNK